MKIFAEKIEIITDTRPTFHDVTADVRALVEKSQISNGLVTVYSPHTTCCVLIQESSHGVTFNNTEYILQDLINVFENIIPTCQHEGQYLHPCKEHVEYAETACNEERWWSLNTDAHLRSVIMGRSEVIPIIDGEIQLGNFGLVWFADFDQVRARKRNVIIQIMGE